MSFLLFLLNIVQIIRAFTEISELAKDESVEVKVFLNDILRTGQRLI